jgi:hypothetical protein
VSVTITQQDKHAGEFTFDVADASALSVGDDLAGESEGTLNQITVVEAIDIGGGNNGSDRVTMRDAWVAGSDIGNKVFVPEIFKGDSIKIALGTPSPGGDGTFHYSRIVNDPGPELIKIANPIHTVSAPSGNDVFVTSGNVPVNTDVTDIMAPAVAAGWTLDTTAAGDSGNGGTAAGTAHISDGANIIQLLINTNELTTEWFRLERSSATTPERDIAWRASSDSSGITLNLTSEPSATMTAYLDTSKGLITSFTDEERWRVATAVAPKGATTNFNIGDKTVADTTNYDSTFENGTWIVTNNAAGAPLTDHYYLDYVTFGGVKERSDSPASLQAAANELYAQAVAYLQANDSAEQFRATRTVIHADILPGQTIVSAFSLTNWTEAQTIYMTEITHTVSAQSGVRYTDIVGSLTSPYNRETAESQLIKISTGGGATSSAGTGGGGGGGASHEPVSIASSDPTGTLTISGQALTFQLTPGAGLLATANVLDVDLAANSGLQFTAAELEMGTPSTLTASTTNATSTTTHTHEVETTNDPISNPSEIVATDSNSRTGFSGVGVGQLADADELQVATTLSFIGAQTIDTTSGNLTIAPAGDIFLDPVGDNLQFDTTVDPQGESYSAAGASAFTNQWKIDTGLGAGYFAYLEADQMHIRLFQADVTMAKANGMVVTDSVAVLSADFTVPNVGNSTSIIVDDNPALGAAQVFQDDDWVRMRIFERDSGLSLYDLWGQVDSYSDNGDGTQDWTFNCEYAGPPSAGDPGEGLTVQAGATVLGYGTSGQGWWEVDARRNEGPFTRIGTWSGANPYTAANRNNNLMTGRLLSLTGADEYGFYAGVSLAGPHMLLTERQAEFQDINITMLEASSPDGGYIRVYALELNSDQESAIEPNGDIAQDSIVRSSGSGTWYSHINENPASGQPDSQWIYNTASTTGHVWFDMEDISHTLTTLTLEAYITTHSFTDDTCQLRARMFDNVNKVWLTDEIKVATESTTDGLVSVPFTGVDTTASDADWAAARLRLSWTYIPVGSDEILTIDTEDGIIITADTTELFNRAYSFIDSTDEEVGGVFGISNTSTPSHSIRMITGPNMPSGHVGIASVIGTGGSGSDGIAGITASGNDGSSVPAAVTLDSDGGGSAATVKIYGDIAHTNGGMVLGDNLTTPVYSPGPGELVLNQAASDDVIIYAISSDVGDSIDQGMDTPGAYLKVQKASPNDGGGMIKGGGDANHGVWLIGSCPTGNSATSTSALAPVIIRAQHDNGAVASSDNAVVMQDHTSTRWILKENGDVHIDGTQNTYDEYDDVAMVRAASLLSPNAIRTTFDDMVQYNRDDLEAADLVNGTFINTTGFMRLHSGAIWQLHQRIAELEDKLNASGIH